MKINKQYNECLTILKRLNHKNKLINISKEKYTINDKTMEIAKLAFFLQQISDKLT